MIPDLRDPGIGRNGHPCRHGHDCGGRYPLYGRAQGAILAVTFRRFLPYCGVVAPYCMNVQQSKEFSWVDQCECVWGYYLYMMQDWQLFQGLPID